MACSETQEDNLAMVLQIESTTGLKQSLASLLHLVEQALADPLEALENGLQSRAPSVGGLFQILGLLHHCF